MSGTIERIVVALDAVSENAVAIGAAARLAARWKSRLHGVFVEDDELIRLARLPFARQVSLGAGVETLNLQQAQRQLRAFAERARNELVAAGRRHGVDATFEVVPDTAAREIVAASTGDFLVAGATTRPIGGHFRVEGRWWSVQPAPASFLLAHRDWSSPGAVAVLLQDSDATAERLLAIAALLVESDGGRLAVLCAPELAASPDFKDWLDQHLGGLAVKTEISATPAAPAALIRRIAELDCRLVALDPAAALARTDHLRELVARVACDVLVVR